jgi:hypothetical protein
MWPSDHEGLTAPIAPQLRHGSLPDNHPEFGRRAAAYQSQIDGTPDALGSEQPHDFTHAIDWPPVPGLDNVQLCACRDVHEDDTIFSADPVLRRSLEQLPRDDPAVTLVGIVDHPSGLPKLLNQTQVDGRATSRNEIVTAIRAVMGGLVVLQPEILLTQSSPNSVLFARHSCHRVAFLDEWV